MGPFLGLFLGSRGALRKDFFCFFFWGAFFLCCCWGACSSFLLLFSVPALSGSCFSSFFGFFLPFLPLGRGVVLFFFLPFLLGFLFVRFSFIFWWFFVVFSSLRGLFPRPRAGPEGFVVEPCLVKWDFFCFFLGFFFWGGV